MGNRGNICIRNGDKCVYLYTHWYGSEIENIARKALGRDERWDDGPYLARIVFCEMIKGQERGETGYGIWVTPPDNEYPIIVLDTSKGTIYYEGEEEKTSISFEDFVYEGRSLYLKKK